MYGGGISIDAGHSTSNGKMPAHSDRPASQIPQFDGPIPYDDDVVSTPNVSSEFFPPCTLQDYIEILSLLFFSKAYRYMLLYIFTFPFCFLFPIFHLLLIFWVKVYSTLQCWVSST